MVKPLNRDQLDALASLANEEGAMSAYQLGISGSLMGGLVRRSLVDNRYGKHQVTYYTITEKGRALAVLPDAASPSKDRHSPTLSEVEVGDGA